MLDLQFDDAVQRVPVVSFLSVIDSMGMPVPGRTQWVSDAVVRFQPIPKWSKKMWYTVMLEMDSLKDLNGNQWRDSTWILRFETMDDKSVGSIEGRIADAKEERVKGPLILTARRADSAIDETFSVRIARSGQFRFADVSEGLYVIDAYRDEDGDGSYGFGRPFPYNPSERFTVYQDTIKVRARWPVEGVKIELD